MADAVSLVMRSLLVLFVTIASTTPALADFEVHPMAETGVQSTYVFRGNPMYASTNTPSSQTTLGLTVKDLGPGSASFSVWNGVALLRHGEHNGNQLEFDVSPSYGLSLGPVEARLGYTAYLYPEATVVDQAHELNLSGEVPNAVATVFASLNVELVRMHGIYAQAGLYRDFTHGDFTFSPRASLAVMGYSQVPLTVSDLTATVAVKWQASKAVYLVGNVSVAERFSRPVVSFESNAVLWGGLTLGVAL